MIQIIIERLTEKEQKMNGGRKVGATIHHNGKCVVGLADYSQATLLDRISKEVWAITDKGPL